MMHQEKIKICIISNLYEPYIVGGAEVVAADIAKHLYKIGKEIFVISTLPKFTSQVINDKVDGIKVYRFYPLNLYSAMKSKQKPGILKPFWHGIDIWNIDTYFKIKNILKEENPDVINTHNISGFSPAVWSAAKSLRIPVVHTIHDYGMICSRTTLLRKDGAICDGRCADCMIFGLFKKFFSRSIAATISPSKFIMDTLLKAQFFSRTKNTVVYNGIEPLASSQKDCGADGPLHFLYIGQVAKHKGVGLLLETFSRLPVRDIQLSVIGTGDQLPELKAKYAGDARIVFHGFVTGQEKEKLMKKCHVAVVPSMWYENSPKVIYEAYRLGMPVVGSRIGGIPELIDDGKSGLLFEAGSREALETCLQRFIDDPNMMNRMRADCFRQAEKFSMEAQVNGYLDVFSETLRTHGK